MKFEFFKLESIGNDFPLIDLSLSSPQPNLGDLAIRMCDRRFGVGGDGLLTVKKLSESEAELRMFNPDGTEDFCGNGIRCGAFFLHDRAGFGTQFTISHYGRRVPIVIENGFIKSEIGVASYDPNAVPTTYESELFCVSIGVIAGQEIVGSALSTGSTHLVIPVEELPSDERFFSLGPLLEHHPLFPIRTSVIWRKQIRQDAIEIRIWERGVGETLGCGTGSSAAVADLFRSRGRGGAVEVINRGGSLWVSAESWDAPITIQGRARMVYYGSYE